MNETGKQLLTVLDRALTESPREAAAREGRTLLKQIHTRFGAEVAQRYASRILSPGGRAEMRALLDGPAPAKAPAATPVKAVVPGLLPPPPPAPTKPTEPAVSTATLRTVTYATIRQELPAEFLSLPEPDQRRAMLVAVWKCHAEDALPAALADEINVVTKGMRRFPATSGLALAASGMARQTIERRVKKLAARK
jgi:hypothetical protein